MTRQRNLCNNVIYRSGKEDALPRVTARVTEGKIDLFPKFYTCKKQDLTPKFRGVDEIVYVVN